MYLDFRHLDEISYLNDNDMLILLFCNNFKVLFVGTLTFFVYIIVVFTIPTISNF